MPRVQFEHESREEISEDAEASNTDLRGSRVTDFSPEVHTLAEQENRIAAAMRNLLVLDPINGASLSYRTAVTAIWPDMRNSPSTHQNMTLTGGSQRPQSQPVYVVRDRHRNTKRPASWTFVDTSSEKIVKTPKFDTVAVESTPHEVSQDRSRSIPSVTVSSDSTGPSSLHQKDAPSVVELSHTSERPARTATVQERPFPPESNLRATPEDQNQVGVVTRNALRRARSKNYRGR